MFVLDYFFTKESLYQKRKNILILN